VSKHQLSFKEKAFTSEELKSHKKFKDYFFFFKKLNDTCLQKAKLIDFIVSSNVLRWSLKENFIVVLGLSLKRNFAKSYPSPLAEIIGCYSKKSSPPACSPYMTGTWDFTVQYMDVKMLSSTVHLPLQQVGITKTIFCTGVYTDFWPDYVLSMYYYGYCSRS
jgi:hypothetical protein